MRSALVLGSLVLLLATGVAPALAQSVGVAAAVNQSALGVPPGASARTLSIGDKVIHNEKISTNDKGLLQILLADGTSFTVGANSSMVIDSFVYDPDADTAKVVATFGKGVFRFIGGRTSKSADGAVLDTPVGTVGIRGGIGDFDFSGRHGIPQHIDMLFGDSITLSRGGRQIGRLYQGGYSLVIGGGNGIAVIPTPPAWTNAFRLALAGHPGAGHHDGPANHLTSTQVVAALTAPSGPLSGTPGPLPTQTGATSYQPPSPAPGSTPPSTPPMTGAATWAEINNSSLANVSALYSGPTSVQFAFTDPGQETETSNWSGKFYLHYYFGRANGSGNIVFKGTGEDEDNDSPVLPVAPNTTTGTGVAGFSGGYDYADDANNYFRMNTQGQFRDTVAGVGNGVAGTITLDAKGGGFGPNGEDITASETGTGTFSGNLVNSPAPQH